MVGKEREKTEKGETKGERNKTALEKACGHLGELLGVAEFMCSALWQEQERKPIGPPPRLWRSLSLTLNLGQVGTKVEGHLQQGDIHK